MMAIRLASRLRLPVARDLIDVCAVVQNFGKCSQTRGAGQGGGLLLPPASPEAAVGSVSWHRRGIVPLVLL